MDLARLVVGWLLVWALGVALLLRLYGRTPVHTPHPAWLAGAGFLAGAFVLTLTMSTVSRLGASFAIATVGLPMLAATIALLLPEFRRGRGLVGGLRARFDQTRMRPPRTLAALAWGVLLAWLALRAALLLGEVLRQPLFPWDAWTQWGTKARVWFALRHMVPFEDAAQWLLGTGNAYYDAAPHYPATVPLWQVWSSVALGRFDDALMNLPWWLLGVALALLLYGYLRDDGASPLFSIVVTWMIVSMPILETHVALAGYADLPMACYLTAAALTGLRALRRIRWSDARIETPRDALADGALALLFVAALPTIKNPGWIWMAVLLPGLLVALVPRIGLRAVMAGWVGGVALVVLLGRYEPVILGYHLHFQLSVPWRGLGEAYLSFANWHLLFWVLPAVLALTWRGITDERILPLTVVVGSGALFLLLGFSLTSAAVWVEDQSTVNRATLHLAPLVAIWLALLVRAALPQGRPAPVAEPLPVTTAREPSSTTVATASPVAVSADGRDG